MLLGTDWIAILGIACLIALIAISVKYRMAIREKHRIQGSVFEDCLCHTFLSCCAVAQEARHVDRDLGLLPMPQGVTTVNLMAPHTIIVIQT